MAGYKIKVCMKESFTIFAASTNVACSATFINHDTPQRTDAISLRATLVDICISWGICF